MPRPIPPDPSPEYIVGDQQRMSRAVNYFNWLYQLAEPHLGRRVLEVGCGLGNFTQRLLDRDLVVGIDSEIDCVERRRARFADHPNVISIEQDVLTPGFDEIASYQPDSIACLNVLEHVRDDAEALRRMSRILPPGGRAVFIVPAFDALYGPVDRNLARFRRYSKPDFKAVATAAGFRLDVLKYVNFIGFFGWWFNGHVLNRQLNTAPQIFIYDTFFVPILSRLERIAEPPVGQSLFAVLCKP